MFWEREKMETFVHKPKVKILLYLFMNEGKKKNMTQIRRATGVGEGYNDKIMHNFKRQNLIEMKKRPDAKNTYNITLTEKGKSIAQLLFEIHVIVEKGKNNYSSKR